jgi:lantibiotic transport system permease protein
VKFVELPLSLTRAINAELLKLKRTLAFRVIFVLPFLVALLEFFIVLRTKKFPATFNLWQTLPTNSLQVWAIFMMPLLIALETALLNGIEHTDKQWKHIFALPVPRPAVYFAKFIVAQALVFISTFFLSFLTVIVGLAAIQLRPELVNSGPMPYVSIAKTTAMVWLAGWLIISIHTWISMRWSGFPIPLGAGIGGTFFALFAASASVGKYYPWLLPMNIFIEGRLIAALVIGVVGGIVLGFAGCFEFVRRDVT